MSAEPEPQGSPVVIAVLDLERDTRVVYETPLTGWWDIENGTFVIPFSTPENAADCLRVLARAVTPPERKETES